MKTCLACGALASDNVPVCPEDGEASWSTMMPSARMGLPVPALHAEAPPTPNVAAPLANGPAGARHGSGRHRGNQ